jgi:hypothetical protein
VVPFELEASTVSTDFKPSKEKIVKTESKKYEYLFSRVFVLRYTLKNR